jgi:uncharacterized membrane protein
MKRFAEIDFLRGIAIVLMVVFHLGFNLNFTGFTSFSLNQGIWLGMARFVQFAFILTTGMTLAISYHRHLKQGRKDAISTRLKHAGIVFGWGMVITLVTWLILGDKFVKFGILHFLGVAMVLALPLLRLKTWNALIGLVVILIGLPLKWVVFPSNALFWLGLKPPEFYSLDYFPLFPWFGLFLIGVAMGPYLYSGGKRQFKLRLELPQLIRTPFEAMGRRALVIYLVHQPIIIFLIYAWLTATT